MSTEIVLNGLHMTCFHASPLSCPIPSLIDQFTFHWPACTYSAHPKRELGASQELNHSKPAHLQIMPWLPRFGLGVPGEDIKAVFRRFYAKHGLRILCVTHTSVDDCNEIFYHKISTRVWRVPEPIQR